jgi:hypothetical protein
MRLTIILFALLASPVAACCVFDNDFLEDELRQWPDALEIITGRIQRQTPGYYEARLQKALKNQLPGGHTRNMLEAARACDQLNRQEEAIAFVLPLLDEPLSDIERNEARSLLVQLNIHRWWLSGTDAALAATCVEAARKSNVGLPNGRFIDRFLRWADTQEQADPKAMLADFLDLRLAGNKLEITKNTQLRDKGLEGAPAALLALLVLHPVWDNFDTYYALSLAWAVDGYQPLAHFARLRAWELHEQGRKSRLPGVDEIDNIRSVTVVRELKDARTKTLVEKLPLDKVYEQRIAECFEGYRDYAKRWLVARDDYLRNMPIAGLDADDAAMWDAFAPSLGALPPLPRPDLQPAAQVEKPVTADVTPAITDAEPAAEERSWTPWMLIGGLLVLLSLGFVTSRVIARKEPEPTS